MHEIHRRRRIQTAVASAVALGLVWTSFVAEASPITASAGAAPVDYTIANTDFSGPLEGTWTVDGDATQERTLELAASGVAYQGIPVTT